MRVIPLERKDGTYTVFMILGDRGIERIKDHDPAELTLLKLGAPWNGKKLRDIIITYASPEEVKKLDAAAKTGDVVEVLKYLTRNWKFLPDEGDNDLPYIPVNNDRN